MSVVARTRASTAVAEVTADGSASAEVVTLPTDAAETETAPPSRKLVFSSNSTRNFGA